jgi:hypothetical protein
VVIAPRFSILYCEYAVFMLNYLLCFAVVYQAHHPSRGSSGQKFTVSLAYGNEDFVENQQRESTKRTVYLKYEKNVVPGPPQTEII